MNLTSISDIAESSLSENITMAPMHGSRRRRDTEYIIKPDTVVSTEDNKERQVVVMVIYLFLYHLQHIKTCSFRIVHVVQQNVFK